MEENNIPTKNLSGFAETIFMVVGLTLLILVPMLYSQRSPADSSILSAQEAEVNGLTNLFLAKP